MTLPVLWRPARGEPVGHVTERAHLRPYRYAVLDRDAQVARAGADPDPAAGHAGQGHIARAGPHVEVRGRAVDEDVAGARFDLAWLVGAGDRDVAGAGRRRERDGVRLDREVAGPGEEGERAGATGRDDIARGAADVDGPQVSSQGAVGGRGTDDGAAGRRDGRPDGGTDSAAEEAEAADLRADDADSGPIVLDPDVGLVADHLDRGGAGVGRPDGDVAVVDLDEQVDRLGVSKVRIMAASSGMAR